MSIRTLHIGRLWQSEEAGGADRVLGDLVRYLPRYDIAIETVAAVPVGSQDVAGPAVFSIGDPHSGTRARWLGTRRAVGARLTASRVDILVSHFAFYASAVLDRLYRMPHVVHFQGPWAAESRQEGAGRLSSAAKWAVERMVYASADRVIVLSQAFASVAEESYRVNPEKIRVIPGAVDLERFAVECDPAQARRELGLPLDRAILVTVRRLVRRTGLDILIEALPTIVAARPDVLLCVGGTGPLRSRLEKRVAELDLEPYVLFLGYVKEEDLPLLYRAAHVNVVPTLALEGFGLTAIEALAAGTPSMVTPVGGLPEAVGPLSPSLIFRSVEAADLADGLIRALSGALPLPTADECRAFVREHFTTDLMARRISAVYVEVCA